LGKKKSGVGKRVRSIGQKNKKKRAAAETAKIREQRGKSTNGGTARKIR